MCKIGFLLPLFFIFPVGGLFANTNASGKIITADKYISSVFVFVKNTATAITTSAGLTFSIRNSLNESIASNYDGHVLSEIANNLQSLSANETTWKVVERISILNR
ncbi:MAG: hypothetical protein H7Z13_01165 [Ferruginibacter sp.]|nr:hypothetical protein [Ferruginibacter sp.]